MGSVYRDRDRYDDSRSVASTRRDDGDRVTKVTRYIIREDDDTRSNYTSRRRDSPEPQPQRETIRITRREVDDRESVVSPRRNVPSYVERDFVIRNRDDDARSTRAWERRDDVTDRELVIRRTDERDDGGRREVERDTLAVTRVDDRRDSQRYDYNPYQSGAYGQDRDLQHYTRTSEYYGPPVQPQTIIIRQDPIIIRERVRDDDYQMIRRSDIDDDRSVATTRRDGPRPRDDGREEEYFYEKRVRERYDDEGDRRRGREISPHDSISQVGRKRDSYSSDDSMVYVKRVEKESRSRDSSSDNKKDLAAGAIAGLGAAELFRSHRKKEGRDVSQGVGRVGRDVGAAGIGALAAEGIRRYRSKSRHGSRSRSRSRSNERERERDRRDKDRRGRSRSRSESRSRLKTLGALGLGAVAVAAAAAVATRKMGENDAKADRRSRSRQRRSSRGSVESLDDLANDPKADGARNPKRRNSRIAAAGAVGAAGAALFERARSKSRGAEGSRERTRIEQGLPIAAAGLGTAALAGLYENNKAKQEAKKIQTEQKRRARSRSHSRRGDRSDSYHDDRDRNRGVEPGMVEYGYGDVAGNNYGAEYYGRAPPQEPFYSNSNAVVPAETRRSRSRSLSRDRGSGAVATGAVAGAAAASEHERRKAEKKERKARRRAQEAEEAGRERYEESYPPQQLPQAPWTPPPNDPYSSNQGFGNQYQSQYPPPPGSMPQAMSAQFQPQYQPPAPVPTPQPAFTGHYTPQGSHTPQPLYNQQAYPPPPPPGMHPQQGYQDPYNAGNATPYAQQSRNRGAPDENVSAGHPFSQYAPPNNDQPYDGVTTSRSIDPAPVPPPPAPTPAIRIHPPTNASSNPSLAIPQTYVAPADRPGAENNVDDSNDRRVQFARSPEIGPTPEPESSRQHPPDTMDSDNLSPDARRQRRRQQASNRGYEAGDDTDLSPNTERRASKHGSVREQVNDKSTNGASRRERNSDRSIAEENDNGRRRSSDYRKDRRSSRSGMSRDRALSPSDSDATIDLPPRFDDKGKKKPEKGDDPVSNRIDDILKGKGTAGKVFGNFMDGLFGPDQKGKAVEGKGEGESRRRRDRDRE